MFREAVLSCVSCVQLCSTYLEHSCVSGLSEKKKLGCNLQHFFQELKANTNVAVRRTGGGAAAVSQSITFTSGTTHCSSARKGEMIIMIS